MRVSGVLLGKKEDLLSPLQHHPEAGDNGEGQQLQGSQKKKKKSGSGGQATTLPPMQRATLLPVEEAGKILGLRHFTISLGCDIRLPMSFVRDAALGRLSAGSLVFEEDGQPTKRPRRMPGAPAEEASPEVQGEPGHKGTECSEGCDSATGCALLEALRQRLGEPLGHLVRIEDDSIFLSSFTAQLALEPLGVGRVEEASEAEEEGQCRADEDSAASDWLLRCRWLPTDEHIASAILRALRF